LFDEIQRDGRQADALLRVHSWPKRAERLFAVDLYNDVRDNRLK
jgi:hypothetical protein